MSRSTVAKVRLHRVPDVPARTRTRLGVADLAGGDLHIEKARWLSLTEQAQAVIIDRDRHFTVAVHFRGDTIVGTRCSCTRPRCTHAAALLEHAAGSTLPVADPLEVSEWKTVWAQVAKDTPVHTGAPAATRGVAVQFAVTVDGQLVATPAILDARGAATAIHWQQVITKAGRSAAALIVQALGHAVDDGNHWLHIAECGPNLWPLLAAVDAAGAPLIYSAGGRHTRVYVEEPAILAVRAVDADAAAHLRPTITTGDTEHPAPSRLFLLDDHAEGAVHGLAWWDTNMRLHLASLAQQPSPTLLRLCQTGTAIPIPRSDLAEFNTAARALLADRITIIDPDQILTQREITAGPIAHLNVTAAGGRDGVPGCHLSWSVRYTVDGDILDVPAVNDGSRRWRCTTDEHALWERLADHLNTIAGDWTPQVDPSNPQFPAQQLRTGTLDQAAAAILIDQTLPALPAIDDLIIDVDENLPDFRAATNAPTICFEPGPDGLGRDWLNLNITVDVDGYRLGIDEVIRQLTDGATHLVFPGGVYTTATIPELDRLTHLLREAREVGELSDTDQVPAGTANATLWDDILDCGHPDEMLADWSGRQHALAAAGDGDLPAIALPATVHAQLRPYQQEGLNWLSFLADGRTGGILADDMGLGKTLQLLSTMAHILDSEPAARFLVIAPTTVVPNWIAEAAKFVPSMTATAVRSTMSAGGRTQAEQAAAATLVVTTYALARIDADHYGATTWTLVVCDEAQHVKNPKSQTRAAIKALPARSLIAATGTPIENTLMDLWSLLDLAAPGLFPHRAGFVDYYLNPIEKDGDTERLTHLRHRIRPYLLRRTKTEVAGDLPPRQDQTIELELGDEHRHLYDLRLNRERQKALELLALDDPAARFEVLSALTRLRQLALHAGLVDDDHQQVTSVKIDYLTEKLPELVASDHPTLVFSVFPTFLRLLQPALEGVGLSVAYLDGTLSLPERAEQIAAFNNGAADVFLISIKAGGSGINLVRADTVFICDPWWNPAVESQATDRAHRIGQTRPVNVYRLVAADTIEGKVVDLQNTKRGLANATLDTATAFGGTLSVDDLRQLLADDCGK